MKAVLGKQIFAAHKFYKLNSTPKSCHFLKRISTGSDFRFLCYHPWEKICLVFHISTPWLMHAATSGYLFMQFLFIQGNHPFVSL